MVEETAHHTIQNPLEALKCPPTVAGYWQVKQWWAGHGEAGTYHLARTVPHAVAVGGVRVA
jgi:hypothetical protein